MKQEKINKLTQYHTNVDKDITERKLKNRLKKEEEKENKEKNQLPVKEIVITIEWKKSKTWGNCPRAEARVHTKDGRFLMTNNYYASGYGYDKESTVISQIFNEYLKYKLWEIEDNKKKQKEVPYGIRLDYDFSPYYEGGVGASCYYAISEFIGGKFELIANGKTFDVYKFTMLD